MYDVPKVPLSYPKCLANRPLVTFLLDHGADPNIGRQPSRRRPDTYWGKMPTDRRSGDFLNLAVGFWDLSLIDLLLAHGVKPENAYPLHKAACWQGKDPPSRRGAPWPST